MAYYVDTNNTLYWYEDDGSQAAFMQPNLTPITVAQATAIQNAPPSKDALNIQAKNLLTKSDITMIRQYEEGNPPPAAWVAYRQALRAFISNSAATTIPTQPAEPV